MSPSSLYDHLKITPINWIDEIEGWILVPGTVKELNKRKLKEIIFKKKNCYFASGVPKSIIDFTYRAVSQLKLKEKILIFSRGMVRNSRKVMKNAVSICELEWGVGTLVTIPRNLGYREKILFYMGDTEYSLRLMELVVLHGLLQIAYPGKNAKFYSTMATLIIAKGWRHLDTDTAEFDEERY
jgi:hypothetical protein